MAHVRILLPSDVFPPRCGGAGWSAHALALALIERGHGVTAVVPDQHAHGTVCAPVLGVPTVRYGYRVPPIPFVKNCARHEWLWPRLSRVLVQTMAAWPGAGSRAGAATGSCRLIVHAQHVQVMPPAVCAARQRGVPVVVTVRDHWPWDYFATGLHGNRMPYHQQGWAALATDLAGRMGPLRGAAALPALPYMLAHVRRRQHYLRQADAVIAVSEYIARRLRALLDPHRIHVIPNMVDIAALDRTIATPPRSVPHNAPYLLFVGKLERNKGAHLLIDIFRALRKRRVGLGGCPELVIAGDGPLRRELEDGLAAAGAPARFLGWVDHDEVVRLMAHCTLLLFPSTWGEPLSRVLLEACACGAAVVAMPTGGTPDMIADGINGALAPTADLFAARMAALLEQPDRRRAFGAAARQTAHERFSAPAVVRQIENLYGALFDRQSCIG